MVSVGSMAMPADFRYREVCLRGRPQHARYDDFGARHPKMPCARRAKIFAPFDALAGFGEAVSDKEIPYVDPIELEQQDREELDRRLGILHELTCNGRLARVNRVTVSVRWYVPCADKNSFAFGKRGLYESVTGLCLGIDAEVTRTIRVGEKSIPLDRVVSLESPGDLFKREAEELLG